MKKERRMTASIRVIDSLEFLSSASVLKLKVPHPGNPSVPENQGDL